MGFRPRQAGGAIAIPLEMAHLLGPRTDSLPNDGRKAEKRRISFKADFAA
jgi:hypothetical protein